MKRRLELFLLLIPILGLAQPDTLKHSYDADSMKNRTFQLGEVAITSSSITEKFNKINSIAIQERNKIEISNALNMLSGIVLTASGSRNESSISVRGFDLRAVPIYLDGIPVYVPYDGYVDLGRFTTFDLSEINVAKGFSSILYGPNSIGGAINLVTRKPIKRFEVDGVIGVINNNGYKCNVNMGSNLGRFYLQASYSFLQRESFILSKLFNSTKNEDGGQRDNSYRNDQKFNIKIGWTPKANNEYVLGYINQKGQKGNPVYCGEDKQNSLYLKPRYWKWPVWNKETFYFLSNSKLSNHFKIKTRIFYDIFKNSLRSYDDQSYTTQNKPYAFQSFYNDYTYGSSIEFGSDLIPNNKIIIALHYKEDVHRENNLNEPIRHFKDRTLNFGIEDVYAFSNNFTLIPGISYSSRSNVCAEDFNSLSNLIIEFPESERSNVMNGQLGLFYSLKENHTLGASLAHKSRFATIKDRYSYRMGIAIPNPELKPELTTNYELNYSGKLIKKLTLYNAFYYSHIYNAIISVDNFQNGKSQMQNIGRAEYMGLELGVKYNLLKSLSFDFNYTYIKRNNISRASIRLTDVPNTKIISYFTYHPIKRIMLIFGYEYNSCRFSTSYGTRVPSFNVTNSMLSVMVCKFIKVEFGVNNIFDQNYSLIEGYPEEGRNYFLNLRFYN